MEYHPMQRKNHKIVGIMKMDKNEKTIEEISREVIKRGNSIEIHSSKDGIKIFEVSKRIIKVIEK